MSGTHWHWQCQCVSVSVCLSVDCGAWGCVREVALSRAISNHLLVPHSKPISAIDIQAELVMVYLVPLSMVCVARSPPQRPSESGPVTKPEPAWTYQTKARSQARRRKNQTKPQIAGSPHSAPAKAAGKWSLSTVTWLPFRATATATATASMHHQAEN
jgi:hypothetical protein